MSTVAELIDRVYLEWLYQPDDQPVRSILTADLTATGTLVSYDSDVISVEEEALLSAVGSSRWIRNSCSSPVRTRRTRR